MAAYTKASVGRPAGMPGAGLHPKDKVILIDTEDISAWGGRDEDGVSVKAMTMASSAKGITLYMTPGTIQIESNSEGDADQEGFRPQITFNHPGNSAEIRKFKANWTGKNIVALVQYCDSEDVDILGSPCNPLRLQTSYSGGSDSNVNSFTLQQAAKGEDIGLYQGEVDGLY